MTTAYNGRHAPCCPIYARKELDPAIGTIDERLHSGVNEVWISGLDNSYAVHALSRPLLGLLKRGGRLKLLSTDTKRETADMLDIIDPCEEANSFVRRVDSVTNAVQKWHKTYPDSFEYRLLPFLPALGFFITDPRLPSQTVKIEVYAARPWEPLDTRPHFVITEETPDWREYFIRQFENYWNFSRSAFA
jgi:hypothetical protein